MMSCTGQSDDDLSDPLGVPYDKVEYYNNGQKKAEYRMDEKDRKGGFYRSYDQNGVLQISTNFFEGRQIGFIHSYDEQGRLKSKARLLPSQRDHFDFDDWEVTEWIAYDTLGNLDLRGSLFIELNGVIKDTMELPKGEVFQLEFNPVVFGDGGCDSIYTDLEIFMLNGTKLDTVITSAYNKFYFQLNDPTMNVLRMNAKHEVIRFMEDSSGEKRKTGIDVFKQIYFL